MAVNLQAAPPAFVKLGSSAWLQTIKYSRHLLPVQSEPFVLPDVTIVEPEFPARQNVDIRVEKGRIARITPAGAMPAAPATIVEAVRGHVVCTALSDMHIHNPPSKIFNLTPLFLFLYLRHGIVRIREAGDTDGTGTPAAVALIESGAVPGIDLHYSYAFVQTGRARWTNPIPTIIRVRPRRLSGASDISARAGSNRMKTWMWSG
jgi:hypothetical protein